MTLKLIPIVLASVLVLSSAYVFWLRFNTVSPVKAPIVEITKVKPTVTKVDPYCTKLKFYIKTYGVSVDDIAKYQHFSKAQISEAKACLRK